MSLLKRRDDVDDVASYAHKLNAEEKAWLNQFMKEYNDAHTKDAVFHKTAAERKICHDKNNARNRCWYTEEKAANRLNLIETDQELESMVDDFDNEINEDEVYLETNIKRYWDD